MVRCQLACNPEVAAKEHKDHTEQSFISTKGTKIHEDSTGYRIQMIYPKGCCRLDLNNLFFLVFLRVLRGQLLFPGLKHYAGFSLRLRGSA